MSRFALAVVVAAVCAYGGTILSAQEAQPPMSGEKNQGHEPAKTTPPKLMKAMATITHGDAKLSCYMARPVSDNPAPGLILVHEWWGLNDWVKRQADRYAEQGYVVLAVDLYRGEVASDRDHAHELMRGLSDDRAMADLRAGFDYLARHNATRGQPVGVMGWCMGGGFALKLAIAEPKVACTVVCYGKPVTEVAQLRHIRGPLLGIWGATDRGIEVEPFRRALDEAGVKATHHVYPGAGHAFLNVNNKKGYNKKQAAKAWKEIGRFLTQSLKKQAKDAGSNMHSKTTGTMLDLPWDKSKDSRIRRGEVSGLTGVKRVVHICDQVMSNSYPSGDDQETLEACMKRLTRGQRIAMAISEVEMEVNNGGFSQYYSNSSGHFAPEAAVALREIGLDHFAEIVNKANSLFSGGIPPREREARNEALERLDESKFANLDSKFFAAYKVEEEIAKAFDKYIETHPDEFFID